MAWSLLVRIPITLLVTLWMLETSGTVALEQFVAGAVPIRDSDNHYPLLYSTVVPIVYKFQLPTWDSITTKIQFWSKHNNCTESDHYEDGYPCPILYHMNYLVEYFTNNMTSWKNLLNGKPESGLHFLYDPTMLWDPSVCSDFRIEPHFKGLQAKANELEKYIQTLSQCTEQNGKTLNVKFVNLTSVAEYLEDRYHFTFMSFTSDYWKKLGGAQEAVSLSTWAALEAALMTHQFMETQKLLEAVQICREKRIPWTLIDRASFKQLLKSLRSEYMEESHDFAIPLEDIARYFNLPLTDCIFGDDNSLVVTIMVPFVPKEAASKNYFVRYRPIPFVNEGSICTLLNGEDSAPFNVGFNGVLPCQCVRGDTFCKAWDSEVCSNAQQRIQETCLQALAGDLEQEIVESCQMQCKRASADQSYEHRRLGILLHNNETDTIKILPAILSDDSKRAIYIECNGNKNMPIPLQKTGAYELSMPRNCNIVYRESYQPNNETVANIEPVQISHLMPYQWRNGIPTLSASSIENDQEFLNQVENMEGVGQKIDLIASKLASMERQSGGEMNEIFIWLFILVSLLMNVGLAVLVHQLYMWKKEQIFKANRLVYNIHPEDEIQNFPLHGDQQTRPLCDGDL